MKTDVQCEMLRRREGQTDGEKQAWRRWRRVVSVNEQRNSRRAASSLPDTIALQMCDGQVAMVFFDLFPVREKNKTLKKF